MKGIKKEVWYVALILLAGCGLTMALITGEEEGPLPDNIDHTITVKTVSAKKKDYQLRVPAWGFVEPAETINIKSELSGKIDFMGDNVFKGAKVKSGEPLFSLDKREYLNTLKEAEAAHEQAQQALEMEMGWQNVVKKEIELLDDPELKDEKNPLMLRQPQLKELKARLKTTEARLAQARLNVEKTRITSPCSGIILDESIAKGQFVNAGDTPLMLVCTEHYNILAYYPSGYLIDIKDRKVAVEIDSKHYEGWIKAMLPQIDTTTRQKQVLIEVEADEITMGAYASIILQGKTLKNVAVLEKEALRASNTLWVLSLENTLELRKVKVLGEDRRKICISEGLNEGDRVVLSHIASPLQGMKLRDEKPVMNALLEKENNGEQL